MPSRGSEDRASTWACAPITASGVRNSCAASLTKERSRSTLPRNCASSPSIAFTSGTSSAWRGSKPSGDRSSALRVSMRSPSTRNGFRPWAAAIHTGASTNGNAIRKGMKIELPMNISTQESPPFGSATHTVHRSLRPSYSQ